MVRGASREVVRGSVDTGLLRKKRALAGTLAAVHGPDQRGPRCGFQILSSRLAEDPGHVAQATKRPTPPYRVSR